MHQVRFEYYKKMSIPGLSSDASEDMFMFLDLKTLMMGLSLVNKSLHDKIMHASERLWLFRLDHIESLAKTKARKGRVFKNECFRSIDNNQLKNETKSLILFRIFRKQTIYWNTKKLGQELLEINGQDVVERIQKVSYKPYVSCQKGLLVGKLLYEPVCDFKLFQYMYGENPLKLLHACCWYNGHATKMMKYFREMENMKTISFKSLRLSSITQI